MYPTPAFYPPCVQDIVPGYGREAVDSTEKLAAFAAGKIAGPLHRFMVWAGDGDPDTFRIKIWTGETVIYDNGMIQPIGGGNIVVHKGDK